MKADIKVGDNINISTPNWKGWRKVVYLAKDEAGSMKLESDPAFEWGSGWANVSQLTPSKDVEAFKESKNKYTLILI